MGRRQERDEFAESVDRHQGREMLEQSLCGIIVYFNVAGYKGPGREFVQLGKNGVRFFVGPFQKIWNQLFNIGTVLLVGNLLIERAMHIEQ